MTIVIVRSLLEVAEWSLGHSVVFQRWLYGKRDSNGSCIGVEWLYR